jgi:hypothetical protein
MIPKLELVPNRIGDYFPTDDRKTVALVHAAVARPWKQRPWENTIVVGIRFAVDISVLTHQTGRGWRQSGQTTWNWV